MSTPQFPRWNQKVPVCDCIMTYKGPTLHRPGCERMAAIRLKYTGSVAPRPS